MLKSSKLVFAISIVLLSWLNCFSQEEGQYKDVILDGKPARLNVITGEITLVESDFYEKSKGPVPEWGIAVAKMRPDRIIMKAPGIANISFTRMKEVIIHELNHIYIFRIPNYNTLPSWFKEGMAMRSSNEFSLLHKIEISRFIWKKQTIPLPRLKNIGKYSRNKVKLAYGESAAAIEALEFYYGEDILINIIGNLRDNQNFEDALDTATGETFADFQVKFELYLEANFNWIFLLQASNYFYVIQIISSVLFSIHFILLLKFKKYFNELTE